LLSAKVKTGTNRRNKKKDFRFIKRGFFEILFNLPYLLGVDDSNVIEKLRSGERLRFIDLLTGAARLGV
jgi:hypothetical protein